MGNDLTRSIKYVDTAEAIFSSSAVLGKIVWTNQNAAGDDLVLSDSSGNVLFEVKAGIQYDYIEFDFNGLISTLTVTTIDSGVLIIYPYLP